MMNSQPFFGGHAHLIDRHSMSFLKSGGNGDLAVKALARTWTRGSYAMPCICYCVYTLETVPRHTSPFSNQAGSCAG